MDMTHYCLLCGFSIALEATGENPPLVSHHPHDGCPNSTLRLACARRSGERHCSFRYDSICVIQSLRSEDSLRTGETLFHEIIKPLAEERSRNEQRPLPVSLFITECKAEFLAALATIRNECNARNEAGSPILQIDAHGNEKKGIQLTNDEWVSWDELIGPLTRINRVSRMNLLVVLAACHGQHLFSILRPGDRSPAWAIVTPAGWIGEVEVHDGYRAFYTKLLTENPDAAWKALADHAPVFRCTAEDAFKSFYHAIAQSPDLLAEHLSTTQSVDEISALLRDPIVFDKIKNEFFMLDLFPAEAPRFPVSLNDIFGKTF